MRTKNLLKRLKADDHFANFTARVNSRLFKTSGFQQALSRALSRHQVFPASFEVVHFQILFFRHVLRIFTPLDQTAWNSVRD